MNYFYLSIVSAGLIAGSQTARSQNEPQMAGERTSVDLTVYNSNMALIREERLISFKKGLNQVIVPDIPATIDGTSLHFASLTDASSVRIMEQNYQYDLVHQAKLLEKYIGKNIEFIRLGWDRARSWIDSAGYHTCAATT